MNIRKLLLGILLSSLVMSAPARAILSAGMIIEQARGAIDEIIQTAFDRLDLTMLRTAIEAKSMVDTVESAYSDSLHLTIDQLDAQQRRVMDDLQAIARLADANARDLLVELRAEKNSLASEVRLIYSNQPGAMRIIPSNIFEGSNGISFTIHGSALSNAKISQLSVNGRPWSVRELFRDDTKIDLSVPINSSRQKQLLDASRGKPAPITLSFKVKDDGWIFGMIGSNTRSFSTTGYLIPSKLGRVQARFVAKIAKRTRSGRKSHAVTFPTKQARITATGRKRGVHKDTVNITPTGDWKIEPNSVRVTLNKSEGCSNNHSSYRLYRRANDIRVDVIVKTDKGSLTTRPICKSSLSVNYNETRTTYSDVSRNTAWQELKPGKDLSFSPSSVFARGEQMRSPRLVHVKLESPVLDQTRIIRQNERFGLLSVSANSLTASTTVRVDDGSN